MRKLLFAACLLVLPLQAHATACSSQWGWSVGSCPDYTDNGDDVLNIQPQTAYDGSSYYVRYSHESMTAAGLSECVVNGDIDPQCLDAAIIQKLKTMQTAINASSYTTENAQDAIGGALSSDFTYNDGANTISPRAKSFTNNASRSLTTGTGATGFQVSATRDSLVNYSVTITTAVQIGLVTNVDGYAVLEIAPTNSSTPGDWVEIARTPQAQNVGLAIALSSTQKGGGNLTGMVPAGYYAKIRTVNAAGTPTYAYNSGQEVLF